MNQLSGCRIPKSLSHLFFELQCTSQRRDNPSVGRQPNAEVYRPFSGQPLTHGDPRIAGKRGTQPLPTASRGGISGGKLGSGLGFSGSFSGSTKRPPITNQLERGLGTENRLSAGSLKLFLYVIVSKSDFVREDK